MIEINVPFHTDTNYVDAVEEMFLEAQEEYELDRINDLYTESVILFDAYTTGSLVLEDVKIGATSKPIEQKIIHGSMNRLSNYFKKIIKFMKEISEKWVEAMSNVFKDAQEWINENQHYLVNIPEEAINTMTLSCVVYWEVGEGKINAHPLFEDPKLPRSPNYVNADVNTILEAIKKMDQKKHDENGVYQEFFQPLFNLDQKSIKKAAFLYYRGGQPGTKKFEKTDCKTAIENMMGFLLNHTKMATAIKQGQEAYTKELERLEEELEKHQAKGRELGTGEENLPVNRGNGKLESDGKTTQAVPESFFYAFDGISLHSELEGASLFQTDFADMIYDTNGYKIIMETAAAATGNTSTVASGSVAGGNNNSVNAAPSKQDLQTSNQNAQTNEDRLKNSIAQTSTNACIQYCRMGGTVFSVKQSVFREISDHYVTTLKQVVDAVKKYQGVLDEEKENKEYNKQQEMNKDKLKEQMVADNIRKRQIRNANKGIFRRIWSNFFGG